MTPIVNDKRLYFEASGVYDGLALLGDRETRSYWHHTTGECLEGVYKGEKLEISNLLHYTFKKALEEYPNLKLGVSKPPLYVNMFLKLSRRVLKSKTGFLPPFFRKTMETTDPRLDEQTMGLGVVIDGKGKFYPLDLIMEAKAIEDTFMSHDLVISYDAENQFPKCTDPKINEMPIQLFTRWYGFSLTHKECEIYKGRS